MSKLPPTVAMVLDRFRAMGREQKLQALVPYSRKLETLPERLTAMVERLKRHARAALDSAS